MLSCLINIGIIDSKMINNIEVKKFSDENVWKYVFHFENAIAEAVLYRYNTFSERTVMCVSVQSGCPVGCVFCGTGKKFIRNLTIEEIKYQVFYLAKEAEIMEGINTSLNSRCAKFQIMFMSMGEPMLNWDNVKRAIACLNMSYPNAQLLLSTIGINNKSVLQEIINISKFIPKVGLQFSIHDSIDSYRNDLIPFKNKLTLQEIRNYGVYWSSETGRQVYLNYCVSDDSGLTYKIDELFKLFDPYSFAFTFSVICEKEQGKESVDNISDLVKIQEQFIEKGYNVRIFDPAGKETIGGGCGQLWYVQDYFKSII